MTLKPVFRLIADQEKSVSSPERYNTIWISDCHLGARSGDAAALVGFLQAHDCKNLELLGDIFDGWKLERQWFWSPQYTALWDEIFRKIDSGTRVRFFPGNHDEKFQNLTPQEKADFKKRFSIEIVERALHVTSNGKKYLILHGHQFDGAILKGRIGLALDWFEHRFFDKPIQQAQPLMITVHGKSERFSMRKYLRGGGHYALRAMHAIKRLKRMIHDTALTAEADGLICGHTHQPGIENIRGITYANSGCWKHSRHRKSHTALLEKNDGALVLREWPCSPALDQSLETAANLAQADPRTQAIYHLLASLYPSATSPRANMAQSPMSPVADYPAHKIA